MINNIKDSRKSKTNSVPICSLCPYKYLTHSCTLTHDDQNKPIYFYCVPRTICRGTGTRHSYTRLTYFSLCLLIFQELSKDEGTLSLPVEFEQWTEITTTYQCPVFCHTSQTPYIHSPQVWLSTQRLLILSVLLFLHHSWSTLKMWKLGYTYRWFQHKWKIYVIFYVAHSKITSILFFFFFFTGNLLKKLKVHVWNTKESQCTEGAQITG